MTNRSLGRRRNTLIPALAVAAAPMKQRQKYILMSRSVAPYIDERAYIDERGKHKAAYSPLQQSSD